MTTCRSSRSLVLACGVFLLVSAGGSPLVRAQTTTGPFTGSELEVATAPLNRYYLNTPSDAMVHFYSTESVPSSDWTFERVEGYVLTIERRYTVPLQRFYNDTWFDHVYTTNRSEAAQLPRQSYVREPAALNVIPADRAIPGTVPLYRFSWMHKERGRSYQDHFYSLNPQVPAHYTAEGICCRVWKDPVKGLPLKLVTVSVATPGGKAAQESVRTVKWTVWTGGSVLRLSYSTNSGVAWMPIGEVSVPLKFGVTHAGSVAWKLPAGAPGPLVIRAELLESATSTSPSWDTDECVVPIEKAKVPPIRIKK
jgi:hypothetical protein